MAEREGVGVALTETTVGSDEEAQALRFPGSPTVRVCGRDLQAEVEQAADLAHW